MAKAPATTLDNVVSLAKRRGFVYPCGEIYGGTRSAWDYGPLGVELKENIKRQWWKAMVTAREDVVGLDSSVILPTKTWEASGHLDTFTDPIFWKSILNTVLITGVCTVLCIAIGLLIAMALNHNFPGRGLARTLAITPFFAMPVAVTLFWRSAMFDPTFGLFGFISRSFGLPSVSWLSDYPLLALVILLTWRFAPFGLLIMLAGLQGSGKTTAAAKLALLLRHDGKRPGLVACDLQRPAAIDQLEQLGKQIQIPVYALDRKDPVAAARLGLDAARKEGLDVVILDTAGRLHVDEELMAELERVAGETKPTNVLLVLDATTGQNGLVQARVFRDVVDVSGIVLTKLDGSAKGGIVVAVQRELGVPVKLVGVGEGPDDLAPFDPETFVDALLGQGS